MASSLSSSSSYFLSPLFSPSPEVGLIMGCAHERSVHLFIDSLVNREQQSVAYRCSSKDAFDRGQCLSCRNNRCNTLGYGAHMQRTTRAAKMYLKTTDRTPFKGS